MASRASFFTRKVASKDMTAQERRYLMALSEQIDILSGNVAVSDNAYNDGIEKLVSLLRSNDKITSDNITSINGQFKEQIADIFEIEYTLGLINLDLTGNTDDAIFDLQAVVLLALEYTGIITNISRSSAIADAKFELRWAENRYPDMKIKLEFILQQLELA